MATTGRGRALVLDPDRAVAQDVQLAAEAVGIATRATTDPWSFLALARAWNPSLIVMALKVPGMDGVQLLDLLADDGCTCDLVLCSEVDEPVLDRAAAFAEERGFNVVAVVRKPVHREALESALRARPVRRSAAQVDAAPHQLRPQDLRRSLARGEITAVFQPRVDCRTGAVVGFEALARWQHPRAGLLPADAFIRTAERGGLAAAVSETVLEQALALLAEPGTEGFEVCVNISSGSLSHGAVQRLTDICRDHGVDPSRVQLEVADGRGEDDVTAQLGFLTRLRVLGFRVSLDDFGVGYSSMAAAARLPVTEIKVDGSFVASAVESQEARAVMKAVTTFCSDLGLRCAAEGAGDRASLLEVVRLGYDVVQGHAVAAPMPAGELVAWLLAHRPSAWLAQLEECATGRSRG